MRPSDWAYPYDSSGLLQWFDPRTRIISAVVLTLTALIIEKPQLLLALMISATVLIVLSGLSIRQLLYRMSAIIIFFVLLLIFLPMTAPDFTMRSLQYTTALIPEALRIGLKASTVMLFAIGLVGTIEPVSLGHAMTHLRMPEKLVQMYLFTIRYFDIFRREMQLLHTAMLARGFRPSLRICAIRSYGQLIGMLIIRSLDRSERVLFAMKCRGYHGKFYLFHHFHFHRRDAVFMTLVMCAVTGIIILEMKP
ncbi:MAG TPA: energy-coupling factor transporter transmembrane component T [Kiritimatiellia bacterium]|nr:energy-coupling factor transporter transmembrane component T [Kiritimatiellia bacterium]